MRNNPKYRLFGLLVIFLIPMLACGSVFSNQNSEPETAPVAAPETAAQNPEVDQENEGSNAESSTNQDHPADDAGVQNDDQAGSQDGEVQASSQQVTATSVQPSLPVTLDELPFQSYRFVMEFATTTNDNVASMQMTLIQDIANGDTMFQMAANGVPDMEELGEGGMTFVVKDDNAYLPLAGECMVVPANMGNPMDEMLSADALFFSDDDVQVTFVGDETVNGLAVKAYEITGITDTEMLEASGMLYIHTLDDGREIVVKAEMSGRNANNPITEEAGETDLVFNVELTDIDAPVTIEVPANCENAMQIPLPGLAAQGDAAANAAANSDTNQSESANGYPIYPGAEFVGGFGGTQNYTIAQSAVDAAQIAPLDFYKEQLAALSWTLQVEQPLGPATSLTFQDAQGNGVQLMIVDEGGNFNITFISGLP